MDHSGFKVFIRIILFFLSAAQLQIEGFVSTSFFPQKPHSFLLHKKRIADSRREDDRVFATNSGTLVLEKEEKVQGIKRRKMEFEFKEINRDIENLKRKEERIIRMLEKAKDLRKTEMSGVDDGNEDNLYEKMQGDFHIDVVKKSAEIAITSDFVNGETENEFEESYSVKVDTFGILHLAHETDEIKDTYERSIDTMPDYRPKNRSLFASNSKPLKKVHWTAMILISLLISVSRKKTLKPQHESI